MIVRFDTLRGFVRERMSLQRIYINVAGADGETDAILKRLNPAPTSNCVVRISGIDPAPAGTIFTTGRRNPSRSELKIAGPTTTFQLKPDRYRIQVEVPDVELQNDVRDVIVFDDTELVFNRADPAGAAKLELPEVASEIVIPKDLTVELQDWATGDRKTVEGAGTATSLPRGSYRAIVRDLNRQVLRSDNLIVEAGTSTDVDDWSGSLPHASIAERFGGSSGGIVFSDSMGPVSDPDLNVWLAILGGGRITAGLTGADYTKFAQLPLFDFLHDNPGGAPVYLLAAFEDPSCVLEVKVSAKTESGWKEARQPERMLGIRELLVDTEGQEVLVSLRLSGGATTSIATKTYRALATFLTMTLDANGSPVISQFVLPMHRYREYYRSFFAPPVSARNLLQGLKMSAEAQRAYRHRRDLRKVLPDAFWQDVRGAEWLDPVATALAGYELVRRGLNDDRRRLLRTLAQKLLFYFPEFPDHRHLHAMSEVQVGGIRGALPIFLDGLRVMEAHDWPLPESYLDYGSPWMAWKGGGS
ncbi:hypothetical protein [Bradyrhizobium vignae]|uniref:Uncharacterized protein n=1 Tax=Bradyrhizobium vignae TaxID=1549949 RepID=A0A2U3PUI1_9BRAD|nr:hypothetical protein [Bradyrhizobium vignae]SPP92802.1 protein of unknown function [Bradyrhizobium vignae]